MNQKMTALLSPRFGLYFICLLAFAGISAFEKNYKLAAAEAIAAIRDLWRLGTPTPEGGGLILDGLFTHFARADEDFDTDIVHDYSGAGVIFGVTGGVTEAVLRRVAASKSRTALLTVANCGQRGKEGIKVYTDKLGAELVDTMTMCGAHSLDEISRDMIYFAK